MGSDGGHRERFGFVQWVAGRERGRRGSRGRPGEALYGEATAHRGRGARVAATRLGRPGERARDCLRRLWAWCWVQGRDRESGRAAGGATGFREHWPSGGALTRAAEERGGRGSKWETCWRDAGAEARRLARGGGPRWSGNTVSMVGSTLTCSRESKWPAPAAFSRVLMRSLVSGSCKGEARGGRGTRCQRSGALPRAPEHANGRHPRLFARTRAPTCVWRLQGVWAKAEQSLGCSGMSRREREAEREGECCCPGKKNGSLPPFNHCSLGSKACRS